MKKLYLSLVLLSFIPSVYAGCIPSDITGSWITYQTNISAEVPHTGRCDIKIADNNARSFTGKCNLSVGFDMDVTGTAKVNNDCSAVLAMKFNGGGMDFDMQLSPDRQSFVGRWKNSFGDVGGTNGVRK